jgi:citrate synthase
LPSDDAAWPHPGSIGPRREDRSSSSASFIPGRKLYPIVDFYSGILYRAMGIPTTCSP